MPRLTGSAGRYGAMVDVKVMLTPQRVEALKRWNMPFSPPQVVIGLIDTGASCSCIDIQLAKGLGLEQRGITHIHTPSTGDKTVQRDVYDVCFVIGEGHPKALHLNLPVIESEFASHGFLILIGRDVLENCIFTYDGPKSRYSLKY